MSSLSKVLVTGAGGFIAPALFGILIASQSPQAVFIGYALAAMLMLLAAVTAALFGVDAERKPLEEVAEPLSAVQEDTEVSRG